jgi:hypothetical protein
MRTTFVYAQRLFRRDPGKAPAGWLGSQWPQVEPAAGGGRTRDDSRLPRQRHAFHSLRRAFADVTPAIARIRCVS